MTEMTTVHAVDHHAAKHNGTWPCRVLRLANPQ
jgi:hypothetical protein